MTVATTVPWPALSSSVGLAPVKSAHHSTWPSRRAYGVRRAASNTPAFAPEGRIRRDAGIVEHADLDAFAGQAGAPRVLDPRRHQDVVLEAGIAVAAGAVGPVVHRGRVVAGRRRRWRRRRRRRIRRFPDIAA